MLKIDAQAPIPRAIIVTATIVNPRFFRNVRQAKPISLMKESMSAGRAGEAPFLFAKGSQTDGFGRPALNCSLLGFMSHYRTRNKITLALAVGSHSSHRCPKPR